MRISLSLISLPNSAAPCGQRLANVLPDECNPNPCLNGGSCELDDAGGYVCSCASDYGGVACATDTSCEASHVDAY